MSDSLFNSSSSSKSTAYKSIFNKSKDNQKLGVGKEEFLARRRLFLERAQNENNLKNTQKSTPKYSSNSSRTYKKPEQSSSYNSSTYSKSNYLKKSTTSSTTTTTTTNKSSSYSTVYTKINDNVPKTTGLAGLTAPKSNSLKSILSQMNKGNQSVSSDEFRSRRKAFEDAQLNDITQLLPRPLTPSGYTYYGRSSPLLGCDRPWSPASERPWSPAYDRRGSPTPSMDSERSYGTSEVRLPWERPSTTKKTTTTAAAGTTVNATKNLVNEDKRAFVNPVLPASPTLSATAITSDEPIAIPITKDSTIINNSSSLSTSHHISTAESNEKLLNEKLQMWYSKVDEELEKDEERKEDEENKIVITLAEE